MTSLDESTVEDADELGTCVRVRCDCLIDRRRLVLGHFANQGCARSAPSHAPGYSESNDVQARSGGTVAT